VPPGEYDLTCASFAPLESTTQMANRSAQPFLHSSRQEVPILYNGRSFPSGDLDPHLTHDCLGQCQPKTQKGTSIDSAVFAQLTAKCHYHSQHGSAVVKTTSQVNGSPQFSNPCSSKTPRLILMKFVTSDYVVNSTHATLEIQGSNGRVPPQW